MRLHRRANYRFENPPLLQIVAERLAWTLFGSRRFFPLLDAAGLCEGERVLDFGCGGGIGARAIAGRIGPSGGLTCVDISAFWLSLCKRRLRGFDNVDFFRGDIRKLPIPESAFDLVFVHRVLRCIDARERQSVVDRLTRLLSPGGRLLVCEKADSRVGFDAHAVRERLQHAGLIEQLSRREGSRFTLRFDRPRSA